MKTKVFAKSSRLVALFAIAGFCVSCADKFDFETARNPHAEEQAQYNDRFSDIVGDIDPNHTWSTAQQVGVQVAVDIPGSHYLRIYSADPRKSDNAYLLAKYTVQGGKFEDLAFDVPVSSDQLCAVLDYGYNSQYQMVDVVKDGVTMIDFADIEVTRAATRAEGEIHTFTEDKDEYYITLMPDGLPEISSYQYSSEHKSYYVSESTSVVNAHAGNCDIYFPEGDYVLSKLYTSDKSNVYLMPGANVTLTNEFSLNDYKDVLTINSGATLTIEKDLRFGFRLFNRGVVNAKNLVLTESNSGCALLFNYGKFIVENNINISKDDCELINKGYLSGENLTIESSSHFYNSGETVISGDTKCNSNYATWRNYGSFTTDNFIFTAYSEDLINNCYMKVNDTFKMILGNGSATFYVGNGGRVETKYFEMGIGRIKMGDNSIFKCVKDSVTNEGGTAVLGITNDYATRNYGIYGPTSGQAVFSAPEIKWGTVGEYYTDPNKNNFCVTYGGHLYVSTNKHFPLEYLGSNPTYYVFEDEDDDVVIGAMSAEPPVLADCHKTYSGDPTKMPVVKGERFWPWVIACEDLGNTATSDFDFNDVVFAVTIERVNDAINASIQPLAAGGTMAAYILYKDVKGNFVTVEHPENGNKTEIHSWLADVEGAPVTTMLNTGENDIDIDMIKPAVVALDQSFTSMSYFSDYFGVKIVKNGEEFSTTTDGYTPTIVNDADLIKNDMDNTAAAAPKMICVADVPLWCWMKERKPIVTGYSSFQTWAANSKSAEAWYKTPSVPANVVKRVSRNSVVSDNSGNIDNGGENTGVGGGTTTTEEPNGYVVKVDDDDSIIESLTLDFNDQKTIQVYATYTSQSEQNVTTSATIELASEGTALIVDNQNKSVKGNLAKVLDGEPSYTFEKLSGDYNNGNEISGDNSVAVKVGVNSTLTKTYKAAATEKVSGSFVVKIAGVVVATIPVTVTPETVDDSNNTTTEDVNVNWSWTGNPNLNDTNAKTQNFTATKSGTLTATQTGSNKTLSWTVTVDGKEVSILSSELNWSAPSQNISFRDNVADMLSVGSILRIYFKKDQPNWANGQSCFVKVRAFAESNFFAEMEAKADGSETVLKVTIDQATLNDINTANNRGLVLEGQFIDITDITIE